MKAPLLVVIVVGAAVGLFLPERDPEPTKPARAADARPAASLKSPTGNGAVAPQPGGWGGETRLKPAANGHFYATAQVNGQPVEFLVDTGATTVALTVDDARRAGISVDPARFEMVGTGASGPVRGQPVTIRTVSLNGKEARELRGAVLEGLDVSLLGQTFLSRFDEVKMTGGEMILR